MNAPEKLPVDRRTFLGGSDAAAILGHSPWKTPLRCYLEKRGEAPPEEFDPDREDLLETGKEMEPVIVNRLIRRYGIKVVKRSTPEKPNRYTDPEYPFLAAEVDFEWEVTPAAAARFDLPHELIGTIQNGEAKKVHRFATAQFGEAETDEVPVQYAAQAMHGQMVTGRQLTLFAVQLGDDLSVYWIKRDDETIRDLRAIEVRFWNENVLGGAAPTPLNLPDVEALFRRTPPREVEADEATFRLVCEMDEAKAMKASAEGRIEELKYEIGKQILGIGALDYDSKGHKWKPSADAKPGKHVLKFGGTAVLSIGLQSQTRIDSDALRARHPEIAKECSKQISFYRFDSPRKKR